MTRFALGVAMLCCRPATAFDSASPGKNPDFGRIAFAFEENRGQTDPAVKFVARTGHYSIFIKDAKAVLSLRSGGKSAMLSMQLANARRDAKAASARPLPGHSNYFLGDDPARWRTGVRRFEEIKVAGVRKGVDLIYHGNGRELEYDLVLAPGADASDLRMRFDGAQSLSLDSNGDLVIHTEAGDLRQHAPQAWQNSGGFSQPVEVRQVRKGRREVALVVGNYDPKLSLTIDPVVSYSTYLGGSGGDSINAVAVDATGNVYVTGTTSSLDFPVTSGSYGGDSDAFVAKLNPGGTALLYAVYIGGSSTDSASAIALDASGDAFITGTTQSSNFPVLFSGSSFYVCCYDPFVVALNSSGVITASRYLGSGTYGYAGSGIATDSSGNVYVTGSAASFPVTSGSFMTSPGSSSTGFVAKLGASLLVTYGTYLGGSSNDLPMAIAIDSNGDAFVTGTAYSANFPTTTGSFQTSYKGNGDAFVTELNAQGSALVYSTFLGGSNFDQGTTITLDSAGNAYVAGNTQSTDFPATSGAFMVSKPSGVYENSAFLAKMSPGGTALAYSSFLGGSYSEMAAGVAVDGSGNAYVVGTAWSSNFPITPGALVSENLSGGSAFLSQFNPAGTSLPYSTYLWPGGSSLDYGLTVATSVTIDSGLGVYVAGKTTTSLFPATPTAFQTASKESGNNTGGILARIDFSSPAVCNIALSSNSVSVPGHGGSGSFTFTAGNGCPWEITSGASFITFSGAPSGFGNGTVNYTVAQNPSTYSTQTGTITVNGGVLEAGTNVFTINQADGSCTDPVLTPSSASFGAGGGIENISVSLPSSCAWNLTNVPPWITPTNSVNSSGPGNLSLYAGPNSYSARMASFTLATKTITVTQAGGSCTLSLTSAQANAAPQAVTGSVGLITGSACTWFAYSTVPWIEVAANSVTGQGNGSVSYIVAGNPGAGARVGSLLIGDQLFTISQGGGPGFIPLSYTASWLTTGSCCGSLGDGGPLINASVWDPSEMAFDAAGNFYIADAYDNRIRLVTTNGIITTFAGGGTSGLGDGGPPTSATLAVPRGVALDASGNVYIADTQNNRIRKISNNIISTIAGTGTAGYNGDNQPAAAAQVWQPTGIVVDSSGNIYFTDSDNNRIRKITSGGVISTIAGTGAAGFSGDGGPATLATISDPTALSIDPSGNLYFIDPGNNRVRRISTGGIISTVAGNGQSGAISGDGGPATSAGLFISGVGGLAVDSGGSIYIGGWNGSIRKVTPQGVIQSISTYINGYSVDGLALDSSGNLYAGAYTNIIEFAPTVAFCTYTVSTPPAQTAAGGGFTLTITATTSSCTWTASSNVSWITVQTASGAGNGSTGFTVAANNSSGRSGVITVAGQSFIITQPPAGAATHLSVTAPSSAFAGVPIQFTVTALDVNNNIATAFTDPVVFASTDASASLPGNMTLTNSVGVFSVRFATTGSQTITATDSLNSAITGTSAPISVAGCTNEGATFNPSATTISLGAFCFQAGTSITANSGFVVNGTASVTLLAGSSITLDPGFNANGTAGATFVAYVP